MRLKEAPHVLRRARRVNAGQRQSSSARLRIPVLLIWTVLLVLPAAAQTDISFSLATAGEAAVEISASAPGASWEKPGAEAALATLYLDGHYNQDVLLFQGSQTWTYRVFLGPLSAGEHKLRLERNPQWSAFGAGLEVQQVRAFLVPSEQMAAVAHAPVLYARADTLGHFSDAPLLMYYELFPRPDGQTIQYSVIFTNEDAGTATDALMARWGRTTDIEYVYRVTLDSQGNVRQAVFQGRDHKDWPFTGKKVGSHPLLLVATQNNVFADTGFSPAQYRLFPVLADLGSASRELLMDRFPWTYRLTAQEMGREGKLREFGAEKSEAVGDLRSYLYMELNVETRGTGGVVAWVKRKGDPRWYSSHRGRLDFVIIRSGWLRTTIELPPGTTARDLEAATVECVDLRDPRLPTSGPAAECTIGLGGKAFLLDANYRPGPDLFQNGSATRLRPGEMLTLVPVQP
jgi:hypothetical protein